MGICSSKTSVDQVAVKSAGEPAPVKPEVKAEEVVAAPVAEVVEALVAEAVAEAVAAEEAEHVVEEPVMVASLSDPVMVASPSLNALESIGAAVSGAVAAVFRSSTTEDEKTTPAEAEAEAEVEALAAPAAPADEAAPAEEAAPAIEAPADAAAAAEETASESFLDKIYAMVSPRKSSPPEDPEEEKAAADETPVCYIAAAPVEDAAPAKAQAEAPSHDSIYDKIVAMVSPRKSVKEPEAETAYDEPPVPEPAVAEAAAEEPAVAEPAVPEPAVTEPSAEEPAVAKPAPLELVVVEPAAVERPSFLSSLSTSFFALLLSPRCVPGAKVDEPLSAEEPVIQAPMMGPMDSVEAGAPAAPAAAPSVAPL